MWAPALSTSSGKRKRASTSGPDTSPPKRMGTRRQEDDVGEDGSDIDYDPSQDVQGRSRLRRDLEEISQEETTVSDVLTATTAGKEAEGANESSESSLFSDPSREPIWLQHLLALFNCDSIPEILFSRASKLSKGWNKDGELMQLDLNCLNSIYPGFNNVMKDELVRWPQRYTANLKRKQGLTDLIDSGDLAVDGLKIFSSESQLNILIMVVSALPEPWCEVTWEAVEGELWEVMESTCLPLLGVISMGEIESYLSRNMSHQKGCYMFAMLKFLIRLTLLLKTKTPPNIFSLISRGLDLVGGFPIEQLSPPDIEYLRLLRSIAEILNTTENPNIAAHYLRTLDHGGSMRSNAAIGLALGSLPPSWMVAATQSEKNELSRWRPLRPTSPSTMEVLAQAQLLGAFSLSGLPGITWEDLSLETKVLVAFCGAKKKAFANAAEILDRCVKEVEVKYGAKSLELLLIGVVLINCWNATGREVDGESLGRRVWSNLFGTFNADATVEFTQQIYLMVAISDSFLGQGKYYEAKRILNGILESPATDNDLAMSATLRLLKMNRRLRDHDSLFDDWTKLQRAVQRFHSLSDTLKYECIEETICILSNLEPKDILQLPQASKVVKILSRYRIDDYQGSTSSRVNLLQNLDELQRFKNELNLFSLAGPQLYYCRKMRERFSSATVQLVEKVGSANWQRLRRIKEMREMTQGMEVEAHVTKSVFQDSGLGSSIGSDPMAHPERPHKARSVTSISSFMSHEEGATLLPPIPTETSNGERTCFICEKPIKGVINESEWRRHAFADLRPYICIVEDCNTDHMNFATRTDFATHLREHQQARFWACTHCDHANESKHLVEAHIASAHTDLSSERAIMEKTLLRDLSKQTCPFCNEIPGAIKFVGHICHHLEEISLTAVPRDIEMDDEDNEKGYDDSDSSSISRSAQSKPHSRDLTPSQGVGEMNDILIKPSDREDGKLAWFEASFRKLKHNRPTRIKLSMLEMEPDLSANVRAGLEEEDLRNPPENDKSSFVDELHLRPTLGYFPGQQSPQIDRPFKCAQCPQSFNRNHDLKRHVRIHLAVKPFPCGHCERSFMRKDALKRHILVKGCGQSPMNGTSNTNRDSQSPVGKNEVMNDSTEDNNQEMMKKDL